METGIIYKATNKTNNKVYIGQTIETLIIRKRKHKSHSKKHGWHFARAIRKYGFDNFIWETIYEDIPTNQLDNMEIWTIANYNTYNKGYNSTLGGKTNRGKIVSEETRKKQSIAHIGNRHSAETCKKMSKTRKGKKRKPFSEEWKRNLATAHGKLNWGKVTEIRKKWKTGKYLQKELAKEYGVRPQQISRIINNQRWREPNEL